MSVMHISNFHVFCQWLFEHVSDFFKLKKTCIEIWRRCVQLSRLEFRSGPISWRRAWPTAGPEAGRPWARPTGQASGQVASLPAVPPAILSYLVYLILSTYIAYYNIIYIYLYLYMHIYVQGLRLPRRSSPMVWVPVFPGPPSPAMVWALLQWARTWFS